MPYPAADHKRKRHVSTTVSIEEQPHAAPAEEGSWEAASTWKDRHRPGELWYPDNATYVDYPDLRNNSFPVTSR